MRMFSSLFILTFMTWNNSFSQESISSCHYELDTTTQTKVYFIADSEPSFPGGMEELKKFITYNLEYPSCGDFEGKVYAEFIVNENGEIRNVQIKKGLAKEIDQAVIDLINKMPQWIPAKCQNENVSHRMILPFGFN